MATPKPKKHKGGHRTGSGRPPRPDKRELLLDAQGRPILNKRGEPKTRLARGWTQLTVTLRTDTVQRLRAGAGKLFVGDFLQFHLDYYPIFSHEEYQRYKNLPPSYFKGRAAAKPILSKEQKRRAVARRQYDRLSRGQRKAVRLAYPTEVRELIRKTNADQKALIETNDDALS